MNRKSGITLSSIVIYVALFFVFTVFAITMSTNMNYKAMEEKANIYVYEQFDKLQYNIISSAKESSSVDDIYSKIVFSNNDEYSFDNDKKVILKNGGVLVKNVESFEIISENDLSDISSNFHENMEENTESICLKITFKKYGKQITKQIFVTMGDEVYES